MKAEDPKLVTKVTTAEKRPTFENNRYTASELAINEIPDDTKHQPPGHSLVAEIPDPNCIPGQHGSPGVPSRFINQITGARAKMDAQFPNADKTGQFNDAGGIPVTIVGVGFYDRPHRQTGRALNNLEIHPILDISFGNAPPQIDFDLTVSPSTLSVAPGSSGSVSLSATMLSGTGNVSFAISGQPAGVTSNITSGPNGTTTLSLTASPTASPGASTIRITGTAGPVSHTAALPLTVTSGANPIAKWEYKLITASTPEALLTQSSALGGQGWELAGVAFDSTRSDSYIGFLKRRGQ